MYPEISAPLASSLGAIGLGMVFFSTQRSLFLRRRRSFSRNAHIPIAPVAFCQALCHSTSPTSLTPRQPLALSTLPTACAHRQVYRKASNSYFYVADSESLQHAADVLSSCDLFGLDTETRPRFDATLPAQPPSLLQLAGVRREGDDFSVDVFIFDLLQLLRPGAILWENPQPSKPVPSSTIRHSRSNIISSVSHISSRDATPCSVESVKELDKALSEIFSDEKRLKVGVGIAGDLKTLGQHYGNDCSCFALPVQGVLDISPVVGDTQVWGLRRLAAHFLGVTISKRTARSNWGRRPLQERQLEYAANDALLSAAIFLTAGRSAFRAQEVCIDLSSHVLWVCKICGEERYSKRELLNRVCDVTCRQMPVNARVFSKTVPRLWS